VTNICRENDCKGTRLSEDCLVTERRSGHFGYVGDPTVLGGRRRNSEIALLRSCGAEVTKKILRCMSLLLAHSVVFLRGHVRSTPVAD
jgi:hypothetical protein